MVDTINRLPESVKHLDGLRVADLVAKVARVTLKDTVRVLLALDVVADFLGMQSDDILDLTFDVNKPSMEEAAICTKAHAELVAFMQQEGAEDWLETIRSVD